MEQMDFLRRLLEAPGPSGFETRAARVWMGEAAAFSSVHSDAHGNAYATVNQGSGLRVMLSGHLDEIGLMVAHVDDHGFVRVKAIGGWDAQVLLGQRVRMVGRAGDLIGVVGRKPVHLMKGEERDVGAKLSDLWLDFGLEGSALQEKLRVGDVGVLEQPVLELGGGRVVSKALDNRIGAFIVLEALRRLGAQTCLHEVTAVGAVQEEIGAHGARVAAQRLQPTLAIIVDVTYESKQPGVDEHDVGVTPFGSGANLTLSALTHAGLNDFALEVAAKHGIKTSLSAFPGSTGTDADAIAATGVGVPCLVLSVPLRYMHSPSEMVDLADVEAVVQLIVQVCLELPGDFFDDSAVITGE